MSGSLSATKRICVHGPNWVGDTVMATPAFRALRRYLPEACIWLVIREGLKPVVKGTPWFDGIFTYSRSGSSTTAECVRSVRWIRAGHFDTGLIMPNSFRTALMFALGNVQQRIGYDRDNRSWMLSKALPRQSENGEFKPTYMADFYLRLCQEIGITGGNPRTELPFSQKAVADTYLKLQQAGIDPDRRIYLMHPGAGFGPSKRWPSSYFARLAEMLEEAYGGQAGIIGAPSESTTAREIQTASSAEIIDLTQAGIDLHLLKCLVSMSELLVSTDSGPRHYGVALGIPTVCLMGPTDPAYSTTDRPHDVVARISVPCGPCQERQCDRDHSCMTELTPERVFACCEKAVQVKQGEYVA